MADHGTEQRGPLWNRARKEHLKIEPSCIACAKKRQGLWAKIVALFRPLRVHHIFPFHVVRVLGRPDLETDGRNLITLCDTGMNHHLSLGHLGDPQSFNRRVREHAEKDFLGKTPAEIAASPLYRDALTARPRDFSLWTDTEKSACRAELDFLFPLKKGE